MKLVYLAALVAPALALSACGGRTGLFAPPPPSDASRDVVDATDAGDSGVFVDSFVPTDTAVDAPPDVSFDTNVPEVIVRNDCPDPSVEFIYLLTQDGEILSFFPPSLTFRTVGALNCPSAPDALPNSMAVDRKGVAYVDYEDGEVFRVSTKNAGCLATNYFVQQGFAQMGMGFSTDLGGPTESLFVTSIAGPSQLATIDVADGSMTLDVAGTFSPTASGPELTGTGDGRLFGFLTPGNGGIGSANAHIVQIDKGTAAWTDVVALPFPQVTGWAFAFYGGEFWIFNTTAGATSTVTRYRPADGSIVDVTSYPRVIVGAGVSTCAPES